MQEIVGFLLPKATFPRGLPGGTVMNTSHLYIIPVETEGGGAAPGVSPDQTRHLLRLRRHLLVGAENFGNLEVAGQPDL